MTISVIVERIEEGIAILEVDSASSFSLPARLLPPGTREGNALKIIIEPDPRAETDQRKRISDLYKDLLSG